MSSPRKKYWAAISRALNKLPPEVNFATKIIYVFLSFFVGHTSRKARWYGKNGNEALSLVLNS